MFARRLLPPLLELSIVLSLGLMRMSSPLERMPPPTWIICGIGEFFMSFCKSCESVRLVPVLGETQCEAAAGVSAGEDVLQVTIVFTVDVREFALVEAGGCKG